MSKVGRLDGSAATKGGMRGQVGALGCGLVIMLLLALLGPAARSAEAANTAPNSAARPAQAQAQCPAGSATGFSEAPSSPFAVGSNPQGLAVGDVDGDGNLDMVTANASSDTVTVLLGDGSGGFSEASGSPFTVGSHPTAVELADFNNDGDLDLATTNYNSNNVTVLLGDGGGGFTEATNSPFAAGTAPRALDFGDLDGDGDLDIVTANTNSYDVSVLLGNGSGGFTQAAGSPYALSSLTYSVAVGDVNGDGKLDIAAANSSGNVVVLLGNGSGGFTAASGSPFAVDGTTLFITLGDVNEDGDLDIIAAITYDSLVTVLLGDGNGGFSPATGSPFAADYDLRLVALGDINGDGHVDIFTTAPGSNSLSVLFGDGSGAFTKDSNSPYYDFNSPYFGALGDVNGDGRLDLLAANYNSANVTVLLNTCVATPTETPTETATATDTATETETATETATHTVTPTNTRTPRPLVTSTPTQQPTSCQSSSVSFTPASAAPFTVGDEPYSIAAGDVNNDGRLDLATANSASNNVTVLLGNGSGGFSKASGAPFAVGEYPTYITMGDLDGDGNLDIVTTNSDATATVLLGNGSGGFSPASDSPFAVGYSATYAALGDVNNDGNLDIAVANSNDDNVTVLLGDGSGGFSPASGSPFTVGASPYSVALGDVNGDGNLDLASGNLYGNNVTVLLGNGSGGFSPASGSPFATGAYPRSITLADLDGDEDLDIITADSSGNSVSVLLGNGSGGFSAAPGTPFGGLAAPYSLALGDLDGDGDLDLAAANYSGNTVAALLGDGNGGFSPASGSPFAAGSYPFAIVVGDFNRDGKLDLADANRGSDNVTVLLNTCSPAPTSTITPAATATATNTAVATATNTAAPTNTATLAATNTATRTAQATLTNTAAPTNTRTPATNTATATNTAAPSRTVTNTATRTAPPGATNTATRTAPPTRTNTAAPTNTRTPSRTATVTSTRTPQLTATITATRTATTTRTAQPSATPAACQPGSLGFSAAAGPPFAVGTLPYAVALGDVNGDGKLDLASANRNSNNVTVLLGNGSGGFSPASGSPFATGAGPQSVALGDIDGDGDLDLATANYASGAATVLLGNGSGGFSPANGSPFATGAGAYSVALGDINGDGDMDLATANYLANNVTVLLGNGSGGFSTASGAPFATGANPLSIALGDLNGDGKLDLATANQLANNVTVLLGNGSGSFNAASGSPFAVGASPFAVALGDVNNDGKLDLATTNSAANNVTVLLGNGSGGFNAANGSPFAAGASPQSVAMGDLDGDGDLDLAIANGTVLLGNGSGGFSAAPRSPFAVGRQPRGIALGDINGDNRLDIAIANLSSNNVTVLLGACAAAPTATSTATPVPFTDLPADNVFTPYIRCLVSAGAVSGYADGSFRPGADVTRGQLSKIAVIAAGFDEPIPASRQTFVDTPNSNPFWVFIERMAGRGIISGYDLPAGGREFRWENPATRGQIAKIIATAANIIDEAPTTQQSFIDVPPSNPFWKFIEQLSARGIISGYDMPAGNREFRPNNSATRGQMAKIAASALLPQCVARP